MSINWKLEISKLVCVKQVIADLDTQKLWPHHLPRVAASNQDILELEGLLGSKIPKEYLEFLKFANGWPGFYQYVDLFGTEDFLNEDLKAYTNEIFEQTSISDDGKQNLLVIATTRQDIDLFCLDLMSGEVIWIAGTEVERFEGFNEFYLAMVDYNREEIEELKAENTH